MLLELQMVVRTRVCFYRLSFFCHVFSSSFFIYEHFWFFGSIHTIFALFNSIWNAFNLDPILLSFTKCNIKINIYWNRMWSFSNLNFSLQIGIFQSRFRSKWIQINIIKMKIMLFFFCAKENWNYICNRCITYHNNLCAIIDKAPVKERANHTSPYICI